jgi:hypothetical protein
MFWTLSFDIWATVLATSLAIVLATVLATTLATVLATDLATVLATVLATFPNIGQFCIKFSGHSDGRPQRAIPLPPRFSLKPRIALKTIEILTYTWR